MKKHDTQLLIFDWDGTLMDSSEKIVNCFHGAAAASGMPKADPGQVINTIGLNLSESFSRLYTQATQSQVNKLVADYREHWLFYDQTSMKLFDGVRDGLDVLQDKGYLLAVATGKSRRGLDRAFLEDDLSSYFVISRCADETRAKPHPQMLEEILDYTGLEADQAVMIGDTTFDLHMAKSASMRGWGVGYGSHRADLLEPLSGFPVARHFEDIPNFLLDQQ